jgi:hypothetical protein
VSPTTLGLMLAIGALSIAWGWLFRAYVRTRSALLLYAALVLMQAEVEARKRYRP